MSDVFGVEEWNELVAAYREKRPVLRPAPRPGRFRDLWSSWELDAICRFTPLMETPKFRLLRSGKQVPPATFLDRRGAPSLAMLRQLWASGVSINIGRLEMYSNRVLALLRDLEAELHCPMQAHFFTTPPQAQGLGVHADDVEVMALGLEGEKVWDVYLDTPRWVPGASGAKVAVQGQTPHPVTLCAGGWLYLPLGLYHEVRNVGTANTSHLGIGGLALPWATLFERALKLAATETPELAEGVPVAAPLPSDPGEIARRFAAVQPYLAQALEAEKYGQPLPADAIVPRAVLDATDATTSFAWRHDTVGHRSVADRIELQLPYRAEAVRLRADLAPAIEAMTMRERFTAADLPLDAESAVLLGRFLANLGVVRIAGGA